MKAEITAGQVSDYIGYGDVMGDDLPPPKVLIADKGYDSDAIRQDVEARGGTPVIPPRRNRKTRCKSMAISTPFATWSNAASTS